MALTPDGQRRVRPYEAAVVKLHRLRADSPRVSKRLDGLGQRVEHRPPGPQPERRPIVPRVLLRLCGEERGHVHVVERRELRQQGQVFCDLVQVVDAAVALAPLPELDGQFRDAGDRRDEAVDVTLPTEAGVVSEESEEVRVVSLGGARTPIRVPAPILHVDDLACSVPPVQRVIQVLETQGRLWV